MKTGMILGNEVTQGILTSGLLAFVAALVLIRLLVPVARHIGLVDRPGGHKNHHHPTPLVGGIVMFVAFAFSVLMLPISLWSYRMLFAGSLLLMVVGVIDDLYKLSVPRCFFAQIVAGLLMTSGGGVVLVDLGCLIVPGDLLSLGYLTVPITVFAAVGVINTLNMIDGLDGLAALLVLIAILALGIIAGFSNDIRSIGVLGPFCAAILACNYSATPIGALGGQPWKVR